MEEALSREEAKEGVPLSRYAAVLAMKGEGLPLEEAVARAGVDARVWPEVERAWEARIEKADEAFLGELDAAMAEAQDKLARPVPPIDRELSAWLDFIRHFASSPAPMELLGSAGMRVEDVFRLQRAWGRRLKDDAALRQSAGTLMQKPLGPMPAIRPEPLRLEPLPAREPPPEKAAPAAVARPPLMAPLPELGSSSPASTPAASKPATLRSPAEAMLPAARGRASELPPPVASMKEPPPASSRPALPSYLAEAAAAASSNATAPPGVSPFAAGAPPIAPGTAASFVPAGMRHFTSLNETQMAAPIAKESKALPFTQEAPESARAMERAIEHAEAVQGPKKIPPSALSSGMTADISAAFRAAAALPFQGGAAPPAQAAPRAVVPGPKPPLHPLEVTIEAPVPGREKPPALPFQPEPHDSAHAIERAKAHAEAVQGPRKGPPSDGMTADVSAALRAAAALPFQNRAAATPPEAHRGAAPESQRLGVIAHDPSRSAGGAATPAHGSSAPLSPVAASMSLEQYASLCVETALEPAKLPEILHRYHLSPEQRAALGAHWQERMTREPALRAAFERAYATYRAWLLEQRGRAP